MQKPIETIDDIINMVLVETLWAFGMAEIANTDWDAIEAAEVARDKRINRPRRKFSKSRIRPYEII